MDWRERFTGFSRNAQPLPDINQQLDLLLGTLSTLIDNGATQLLVANVPNLGTIPENRGQPRRFWDSIHPTTAAHEILGQRAFSLFHQAMR